MDENKSTYGVMQMLLDDLLQDYIDEALNPRRDDDTQLGRFALAVLVAAACVHGAETILDEMIEDEPAGEKADA